MKRSLWLTILAFLLLLPAPYPARAACDYEIGESGTTLTATRTDINEELTCIETAIGSGGGAISDGDKGDVIVSGSGATWLVDTATVPKLAAANVFTVTQEIELSDDGAGFGPNLQLDRISDSPVASDGLGRIQFLGRNDAAAAVEYSSIAGVIVDPTAGSVDGRIQFRTTVANTVAGRLNIAQGTWAQGATGGDQGANTANFSDYFDDGANINTLYQGLDSDLTAIAAGLSIPQELSPAAGDFLVLIDAGGTWRLVDWDDLPAGGGGLTSSDIDTSAELRAIVTDEVGTGALMFGIHANMSDDITCGASEFLKRNSGDTAWECSAGTGSGLNNIVEDTTPQLGGDLDGNAFDVLFDTATGIRDESDNEQLIFATTASAVNYWRMTNSATGGIQRLEAAGDDAAIAVTIASKSTDPINFEINGATEATLNATNFSPGTNDGNTLGVSGTAWADLFLASGGLIEFDGGTSNTLTCTSGNCTIEGNALYRVGGTDVAIADGGTGASTAADAFTALKQAATESATGVVELATTGEVETGTDTSRAVTAAGVLAAVSGVKTISVPGGALVPAATAGCTAGTAESATNDINYSFCGYTSTAADEAGWFQIAMPKGWNEGTITAQFYWTATSGTGNVVWGLACVARSDDDAIDTALGTQVTVTDGLTATGDLMISGATGAHTIGGTPAENDMIFCQAERVGSNGSDTFSGEAKLVAVKVLYTTNAFTDD